jgi:hypothetical protein
MELECGHDNKNLKQIGRTHYICEECGEDVILELVIMHKLGNGMQTVQDTIL